MSQDTARRQRRSAPWGEADIPSQDGRIAVITGANSGIGYEAAEVPGLARRPRRDRRPGRREDRGRRRAAHQRVPQAQADTVALTWLRWSPCAPPRRRSGPATPAWTC